MLLRDQLPNYLDQKGILHTSLYLQNFHIKIFTIISDNIEDIKDNFILSIRTLFIHIFIKNH